MNTSLIQALLEELNNINKPNFPTILKWYNLLAEIEEQPRKDDGETHVFIIYAPSDKDYARRLESHLSVFVRWYKVQVHLMPVEPKGLTLWQILEIAKSYSYNFDNKNCLTLWQILEIAKYAKSVVYYLETVEVYNSLCDQIDILTKICYELIPVLLRPVSKHLIELPYVPVYVRLKQLILKKVLTS